MDQVHEKLSLAGFNKQVNALKNRQAFLSLSVF